MKRVILSLSIICLLTMININNLPAEEQLTKDFVEISPQFYQVILENDKVRVLEYRLPTGAEEKYHVHHRSGVIFYLEDAIFKVVKPDDSEKTVEVKKGDTLWREPDSHLMVNIGKTDLIARVVELKN